MAGRSRLHRDEVLGAAGSVSLVPPNAVLLDALQAVAVAGGRLATFCDRVEHNEAADLSTVQRAASALRTTACRLAEAVGVSIVDAYARRLSDIERGHLLGGVAAHQTTLFISDRSTLLDLQVAQVEHDRVYHPDVFGMPKVEQLRHYTLHVAKLAGLLAEALEDKTRWPEIENQRLADLLLFGLKISTVTNARLSDDLPAREVLRLA